MNWVCRRSLRQRRRPQLLAEALRFAESLKLKRDSINRLLQLLDPLVRHRIRYLCRARSPRDKSPRPPGTNESAGHVRRGVHPFQQGRRPHRSGKVAECENGGDR
jgi:hypothetical protein